VKCTQCKKILDLSSFRKHEETFYCIKHYGDILNPNIKTNKVYEVQTKVEAKNMENEEEDVIYSETKVNLKDKESKFQNSNSTMKSNNSNNEKTEIKAKNPKCASCNESVYPIDKIEVNNQLYHKNCVKCGQCKKILYLSTFRKHEETFYCIKHYGDILNPNIKTNKIYDEKGIKAAKNVETKEDVVEENVEEEDSEDMFVKLEKKII